MQSITQDVAISEISSTQIEKRITLSFYETYCTPQLLLLVLFNRVRYAIKGSQLLIANGQ